ncbi:hypothetical protein WICPIJ_001310 [Wickerhamomyces pijperi]|uniref:Uncharacterized protein n=1 Tax=Wickerhamomyces pijperi TaxID=599730 RepID=A0A9P8QDR6_WICPI|nr:hypothetical protein WICPIJ_001310 [Wickerhamomyces pijperi]
MYSVLTRLSSSDKVDNSSLLAFNSASFDSIVDSYSSDNNLNLSSMSTSEFPLKFMMVSECVISICLIFSSYSEMILSRNSTSLCNNLASILDFSSLDSTEDEVVECLGMASLDTGWMYFKQCKMDPNVAYGSIVNRSLILPLIPLPYKSVNNSLVNLEVLKADLSKDLFLIMVKTRPSSVKLVLV